MPHTAYASRPFTSLIGALCPLLRSVLTVVGLGWALAAMPAERTLYKSILPNGRVVYGDAPDPLARRNEKISVEIHPPDPVQTEAALRALAMTRQQLLRDSEALAARRRQIEQQILAAYAELQAAEAERERGIAVREGDRQGRRFSAAYLQRQNELASDVLRLRRNLDALLRERSALS